MNLPYDFECKMSDLLGAQQFEAYKKALSKKPFTGLRVNTLKISPCELKGLLNASFRNVEWCGEGFYYNVESNRMSKTPYYYAGLYYLQEPSAMLPVSALPISKGDIVLDMCASPGGKSTHIAAKLGGTGALVSNDINPARIAPLAKNIEQAGITNCIVTNGTPAQLYEYFGEFFDKILIDAPCSGEGMFRKDAESILAWDINKPARLSQIQAGILEYGSKLLKPGGLLAYSTCTFSPEENELQIQRFLESHKEFEIYKLDNKLYNVSKADMSWAGQDERLASALRVFPHKQDGEGHFCAVLKKPKSMEATPNKANSEEIQYNGITAKDLKISIEYFTDFCNNYICHKFDTALIKSHGNLLYIPPFRLPNTSGLRIVSGGFKLGYLKNKRFEPSFALALGLKKYQYGLTINFDESPEEMRRFLNGEAFDVDKPNGYYIACAGGYALDFVKILNGRLKWRARQ